MVGGPILMARLNAEDDSLASIVRLEPAPFVSGGFSETMRVTISAPAGEGWSLAVDDEVLEKSGSGEWRWSPGFYSGRVCATLHQEGRLVSRYVLDVSPDSNKLSTILYEQMLDEIRELDPHWLIGTEPAEAPLGVLGDDQDPWLELRRLRHHAPSFLSALAKIVRQPLRTRRATRRVVPLRSARRLDARTLSVATLGSAIGALLPDFDEQPWPGQAEPVYDVPCHEVHLDGAANRCIAAMLLAVHRRTQSLALRLQERVDAESASETRTALSSRWPRRREFLEETRRSLEAFARREPFLSVTEPTVTAAGLNAVAAHPDYAGAYQCGWRATRGGMEGIEPDEAMWLLPTFDLYERWCCLQVVRLVQAIGVADMKRSRSSRQARWQGTGPDGNKVTVCFQRQFRAADQCNREDFWSVSRERRPDIVVTAGPAKARRFLVLDAKYTQRRANVLEAMASAHIYADSLRCGTRRPMRTLLLVPAGGGSDWLEHAANIEAHGVGVVVLGPVGGVEGLRGQIMDFIGLGPGRGSYGLQSHHGSTS